MHNFTFGNVVSKNAMIHIQVATERYCTDMTICIFSSLITPRTDKKQQQNKNDVFFATNNRSARVVIQIILSFSEIQISMIGPFIPALTMFASNFICCFTLNKTISLSTFRWNWIKEKQNRLQKSSCAISISIRYHEPFECYVLSHSYLTLIISTHRFHAFNYTFCCFHILCDLIYYNAFEWIYTNPFRIKWWIFDMKKVFFVKKRICLYRKWRRNILSEMSQKHNRTFESQRTLWMVTWIYVAWVNGEFIKEMGEIACTLINLKHFWCWE